MSDEKNGSAGTGGEAAQTNMASQATALPGFLKDLPVRVDVMLGSVEMSVRELMECGPGSVLDVGKKVNEPFDLYVNHVLVARGETVMMHDRLALKITEVIEKVNDQQTKTATPEQKTEASV